MREYLLSIVCAAWICSILNAIGGEGNPLRKLLSAIFLALTLFHPLGSLELPEFSLESFRQEALAAAADGTKQAERARNEIISDSLEAYILTRANALGLTVEAEVRLGPDGAIEGISVSGQAGPSERQALLNGLSAELGLGREELEWKDPYQSSGSLPSWADSDTPS